MANKLPNATAGMTFPRPKPDTPPSMVKKIGKTTYLVWAHFSETSTETMEDKIKRMLREEVRQMIAEAMGVDTTDMDQATYRKAAIDAVRQLSADVGIPTKLETMKEEDLQFLAESAAADACAPGNPKAASVDDFKALFRKII